MGNGVAFERKTRVPDGIHEDVETNALRNERRWRKRMRFEWFMDKLAPYVIVALIVVAFLTVGYMESAL